MFDKELLKKTLSIQSCHGKTERMQEYILDYFDHTGYTVRIEKQENGNIYVTKGTSELYPCMVSHIDTVHAINMNSHVFEGGGIFTSFDTKTMRQHGIGGDDKVGVAIALMLMNELPNMKAAFFIDEEVGCVGSRVANMDFFKDVSFILQCDRRGDLDFTESITGKSCFGNDFKEASLPIRTKYNRTFVNGGITDAGALLGNNVGIVACNMSCGYHQPHHPNEYVVIDQVKATHDFCLELYQDLGHKRWEHKSSYASSTYIYPTYNTGRSYANGSNGSSYKKPASTPSSGGTAQSGVIFCGYDLQNKPIYRNGFLVEDIKVSGKRGKKNREKIIKPSFRFDYVYFPSLKRFSNISNPKKAELYYRYGLIAFSVLRESQVRAVYQKLYEIRSINSYEQTIAAVRKMPEGDKAIAELFSKTDEYRNSFEKEHSNMCDILMNGMPKLMEAAGLKDWDITGDELPTPYGYLVNNYHDPAMDTIEDHMGTKL